MKDVELMILSPTIEENLAVQKYLPNFKPKESYDEGSITIENKEYKIVSLTPGKEGSGLIQQYLEDALKKWNPRYVFLVGVCCGFQEETNLFDLILPQKIISYLYKSKKEGEFPDTTEHKTTEDLVIGAKKYFEKNHQEILGEILKEAGVDRGLNCYADGKICTGDVLIEKILEDTSALEKIKTSQRKLFGYDMESSGVGYALEKKPDIKWMTIRCVMDHGTPRSRKNSNEKKLNKELASNIAAKFCFDYFNYLIQNREILPQKEQGIKTKTNINATKNRSALKLNKETESYDVLEWLETEKKNIRIGMSSLTQDKIIKHTPIPVYGKVEGLEPGTKHLIVCYVETDKEYEQGGALIDDQGYWRIAQVNLESFKHFIHFKIFDESKSMIAKSDRLRIFRCSPDYETYECETHFELKTDKKKVLIGLNSPKNEGTFNLGKIPASGQVIGLPKNGTYFIIGYIYTDREYQQSGSIVNENGYWKIDLIHLGTYKNLLHFKIFDQDFKLLAKSRDIIVYAV